MSEAKVSWWHKLRNLFKNQTKPEKTPRTVVVVTNDSNVPNQKPRVYKLSDFSKVLQVENVKIGLDANSRTEVLKYLATMAQKTIPEINSETVYGEYLLREQQCPTNLGDGVAMPHVKSEAVKQLTMLVVKLTHPIKWTKDTKVDIVISFLVPDPEKDYQHVPYLASVARLLLKPNFLKKLKLTQTESSLVNIFDKG
mgnify:CR=1 FL=1